MLVKAPFTWDWLTQDGAVFFTAVLGFIAVVQAVLFIWQLILIRGTLKVAQDSAQTAHRAIDEARKRDEILERAYLWPGFGESYPVEGGRKWRIRVWNSGQTVGILQTIHHALVTEDVFEAGKFKYETYSGREDVIPPSLGKLDERPTGLDFVISTTMVSSGWIVYEDVFGNIQRQAWKHTLNLEPDSAGNYSIPFPGAYSSTYRPWESEKRSDADDL